MNILEVAKLKCVRGDRQLFVHLGFRIESGGLLYLRGANGAGKTSLLRILCGLSRAEAGQILWNGTPIDELGEHYRRDLIYLGHQNALQDALTVDENLTFCASLAGAIPSRADTANAMARLGLRNCQTRLVRHLSQGQKRRAALSRLVFSRASLWVLDEPFVGLDQDAIQLLNDLIATHLNDGGLAVLTSHQQVDIGTVSVQVLELNA